MVSLLTCEENEIISPDTLIGHIFMLLCSPYLFQSKLVFTVGVFSHLFQSTLDFKVMGQFASKPQRLTQVYEVYMVDVIVSGKRLSIHKRKANNNHKADPDIKYMGTQSKCFSIYKGMER